MSRYSAFPNNANNTPYGYRFDYKRRFDYQRPSNFSSDYDSANTSSGLQTPPNSTPLGGGLGRNDSIASISSVKTQYPPGAYIEDEQDQPLTTDPVERPRSPMKIISDTVNDLFSVIPPLFSLSAGKRQACSNSSCTCEGCDNFINTRRRKTYEETLPKTPRRDTRYSYQTREKTSVHQRNYPIDPQSRHRPSNKSTGSKFSSASSSSKTQSGSIGGDNGSAHHNFEYTPREKRPYFNAHTTRFDNLPESPERKPRPYAYTFSSSKPSSQASPKKGSDKPRPSPSTSSSRSRPSGSSDSNRTRSKPGSKSSEFASTSSTPRQSSTKGAEASAGLGTRSNEFDQSRSTPKSRRSRSSTKSGTFGKQKSNKRTKECRYSPYLSSGRKPRPRPSCDDSSGSPGQKSSKHDQSNQHGNTSRCDTAPPPTPPQQQPPAQEAPNSESDPVGYYIYVHEIKWKALMMPRNEVSVHSSWQLPWPMFTTPNCAEDVTEAAVIQFILHERYPPFIAASSSVPGPKTLEKQMKVLKKVVKGELLRVHETDKFPTYVLSRFDGRFPSEKEKAKEINGALCRVLTSLLNSKNVKFNVN